MVPPERRAASSPRTCSFMVTNILGADHKGIHWICMRLWRNKAASTLLSRFASSSITRSPGTEMASRAPAVAAGWASETARQPRASCTRTPGRNHRGGSILAAIMAHFLAATDNLIPNRPLPGPSGGLRMGTARAEDRAPWRHDPSADPGAKTEGGRHDAALSFPFGIGTKAANRPDLFRRSLYLISRPRFLHFTLNQHTLGRSIR